MGRLKDLIRHKLDGQEHRQALRDQARRWRSRLLIMRTWRRDGKLANVDEAIVRMAEAEVTWTEVQVFGMRVITTRHGMILPYGPNGVLDWSSFATRRRERAAIQMVAVRDHLFSDATCASSSV